MKIKARGGTIDIHPLMIRDGRMWDPIRQAHYPGPWPTMPISMALGLVLGWFGSGIRPVWLAMIVIIGGAVALGAGAVKLRWWLWRRRYPELPGEVWIDLEMQRRREAARWN